MLGILDTKGGVGIYDIGQKVANLGFLFMTVLQQVFSPEVFSSYMSKPSNFSRHIGEYLTPFFFVSLFFCLSLGIFSQEIIYLLTTPSYYNAFPIVIILNMLYATYFFGKQPQLLLAKKTKLISFLSLIAVGLNIIINIPLIKLYGIMGAALGTFFSGIIVACISFYYAQKHAKILYNKHVYLMYVLFQISMFVILFMWGFEVTYFLIIIIKLTILMGFLWLGFKFKMVDKKSIKKLLKKN
tara:strand:- start:16 stop:738 length:723 start_codon:yes stop_codon:yes gene_type:complete